MAGKQRAKKGDREKSLVSKQRFWVKILFSMGDNVTQLQGTLQSGPNVMFGRMTFSNQMNNQSGNQTNKQTTKQTTNHPIKYTTKKMTDKLNAKSTATQPTILETNV